MNLKHLEIYIEVVEHKSFSKAADKLYVSQPSVSVAVNALERELGTQLLFRTTKTVLPTQSGSLFYDRAKQILTMCEQTKVDVYELSNPTAQAVLKGTIDVFASSVPAQYVLPEVIANFQKKHQDVNFNVMQLDSAEVVKQIVNQVAEVGLVGFKHDECKCRFTSIYQDRLLLIGAQSCEPVNIVKFLKTQPFISRERGSGTRDVYELFLSELDFDLRELNISTIFNNANSILQAVSRGMGVTIISELTAKFYLEHGLVHAIETDIPLPKRDLYLVTKNGVQLSAVAQRFIKFLSKDK